MDHQTYKKEFVSLLNYELTESNKVIDSPMSLYILTREGIDPK